jgi:hypothetical protein
MLRAEDDYSCPVLWYEAITCLACKRVYLVNPKTGKLLGKDNDWG